MKKKVEIYTDGACSGNPGVGGWGVVMLYKGHKKEASGAEASTTNNRMELTAIIQGLKMLKEPCVVTIYSDSAYSVEPFLKGWINGWIMKGWRTSSKDEVKTWICGKNCFRLCKFTRYHTSKSKDMPTTSSTTVATPLRAER